MSHDRLPSTALENIDVIVQIEQDLIKRQARAEQIGGEIAAFFGSFRFIIAHAVFFAVWIAWNAPWGPGLPAYDPYPFPFLGLVVGIEFIFLTTFVLMNQKHLSKRQEQWSHLTLQAVLLAEREVTKNMQMLDGICQKLGLEKPAHDKEVKDLAQKTPVAALVEEIDKAREVGRRPGATKAG